MEERMYEEFTQMIEKDKDFLWSHAYGMTKKGEDAEDLFQETLMKAFKGWDSFDMGTNFRAWMGRIMLNTHINNINRRRSDTSYDFSAGENDRVVFQNAEYGEKFYNANPERVFFSTHIDDRLVEALYSLPDQFRKPFSLYLFEGFQYEEIAAMLKLPVGTIKSRIFRARKALKDHIQRLNLYEGRSNGKAKSH
ncbi:MAG: sigma-70 family RNA polymerase sigma factor [bacterium]